MNTKGNSDDLLAGILAQCKALGADAAALYL
jgi:hypothetical protein